MISIHRKLDTRTPQQYPSDVLAVVTFHYVGAYPTTRAAAIRTGLVTAVSKTKGGEIELIVRVDGINLPKRVADSAVISTLYVNEVAASAAIAALA